jgi:hypothetical protein
VPNSRCTSRGTPSRTGARSWDGVVDGTRQLRDLTSAKKALVRLLDRQCRFPPEPTLRRSSLLRRLHRAENRPMFDITDRHRVRDRVLDLASSDARVVAGAVLGSLAREEGDRWSDLDPDVRREGRRAPGRGTRRLDNDDHPGVGCRSPFRSAERPDRVPSAPVPELLRA